MWGARRSRVVGAVFAAATLMVTATGCGLLDRDGDPALIESYITGIEVLDDAAESQRLVKEQLGAGQADGPAAQVSDSTTVVNGGSVQESVSADKEFRVVRLALEALTEPTPGPVVSPIGEQEPQPTSTGAPSPGYHEITLKQAGTTVDLVVTVNQALPGQNFLLYFAVADAAGTQGPLVTQTVRAVDVGTGDVQVSISWDVDSDVDLHVVDPDGEEIYFGNLTSSSGGELDLDSNPDCEIDGVRNENITWKTGTAPAGTYTVRVDLYAACGVSPTNYVVTVQVVGQPTRTYSGTLTGEGDAGGEGAGVEVATFEVTGTPSPTG